MFSKSRCLLWQKSVVIGSLINGCHNLAGLLLPPGCGLVFWWITHEIGFHVTSSPDLSVHSGVCEERQQRTPCSHEGGFVACYFCSGTQQEAGRSQVVCCVLALNWWCVVQQHVGHCHCEELCFFLSGTFCIVQRSLHHHLQSIFLLCSSKPGVRSLNETQSSGDEGKKIAFPWAGSGALTPVMMFSVELTWSRTEMGEIMIVWCSGGGENGERYWVIRYSRAGSLSNRTRPKTGKPNCDDWCSSPHQIGCCIMGIQRLYCWMCWGKASCCADIMAYVLRQTYTPHQLHRESCVCPSVRLSDYLSAGYLTTWYPWCFTVR